MQFNDSGYLFRFPVGVHSFKPGFLSIQELLKHDNFQPFLIVSFWYKKSEWILKDSDKSL